MCFSKNKIATPPRKVNLYIYYISYLDNIESFVNNLVKVNPPVDEDWSKSGLAADVNTQTTFQNFSCDKRAVFTDE